MQWSKLKKRVEEFICEELKGRIELFTTWYTNGGSPARGRGAVLLDKKEIFEANTDKLLMCKDRLDIDMIERIKFHEELKEYLSLSIENSIQSTSPLIRGLAFVDKRLGKRTIEKIELRRDENEFVRILYNLRCDIEGIKRK